MDSGVGMPVPNLFRPHPNLGDAVNHNFIASEVEGGVFLPAACRPASTRFNRRVKSGLNNGVCRISGQIPRNLPNIVFRGHPPSGSKRRKSTGRE
jgi:hypothetical protein